MATVAARFDPPHPMRVVDAGNSPPPTISEAALPVPATAGGSIVGDASLPSASLVAVMVPDELRDQLSRQAAELSAHLRAEADDVDRREAQLHARLSELEQQLRSATLWNLEQRAELDSRCDELDLRQRELDRRAASLDAAECFLDKSRHEFERRLSESPCALSLPIEVASTTLHAQSNREQVSGARPNSPSECLELERAWSDLRAHQQRLTEQAYRQRERERQLDESRQDLVGQNHRINAQLVGQRDELARQTVSVKRNLARRMAALERRRAALDRLHVQVKARYRQALQVRLAAEKLCSELAGAEGAALLRRAAAESQVLLAENDRQAEAELIRQSTAIEAGRAELARRHAQLIRQRDQLAAWYRRRQAESPQGSLSRLDETGEIGQAEQTA